MGFFLLGLFLSAPVWANPCTDALVERGVQEIRTSLQLPSEKSWVAARAIQKAEQEITASIQNHENEVAEWATLADQAKGCGANPTCLKPVAEKAAGKAALLRVVLANAVRGEKRAESELLELAPELARQWVKENYPEFHLASDTNPEIPETETLTRLVHDRLKREIQGERFSLVRFFKQVGSHLWEAGSAFSFRALRAQPKARKDWAHTLVSVLSLQVGAHLLNMGTDFVMHQPLHFWNNLWIYANTAFMVTIQAEIGARNTTPTPSLEISNYKEAMQRMPTILHGEEGYWKESKRKVLGFLALLPLDYAVSVLIKTSGIALSQGVSAVQSSLYQTAIVNLASVAIFGSYLSLRWALMDKWFYLNLVPAFQETTWRMANEKLAELKAMGKVPEDNDVWRTVRYLRAYPDAFHGEEAAFLQASRSARNAHRIEWVWRYGWCLVDSYVVFGLFGNWLPAWLGFSSG